MTHMPLHKTHQWGQLHWALDLFSCFLRYAKKTRHLEKQVSEPLEKEIRELRAASYGNEDPIRIAAQFNRYIEMANSYFKREEDVPFPPFSFLTHAFSRSAMMEHLAMLELALSEAGEAKAITWESERGVFRDLMALFSTTEKGEIAPQAVMARLVKEIERINQSLPEDEKFPLPDIEAYQL